MARRDTRCSHLGSARRAPKINMKAPGVIHFGCNLNEAMHAAPEKIDSTANLMQELNAQNRARDARRNPNGET